MAERKRKMIGKIDKTELNVSRCMCLECPSYSTLCKIKNVSQNATRKTENLINRTHYEKMFCAFEKSNCIHLNKGCICENCPNFKAYNLEKNTYCLHTGGLG